MTTKSLSRPHDQPWRPATPANARKRFPPRVRGQSPSGLTVHAQLDAADQALLRLKRIIHRPRPVFPRPPKRSEALQVVRRWSETPELRAALEDVGAYLIGTHLPPALHLAKPDRAIVAHLRLAELVPATARQEGAWSSRQSEVLFALRERPSGHRPQRQSEQCQKRIPSIHSRLSWCHRPFVGHIDL